MGRTPFRWPAAGGVLLALGGAAATGAILGLPEGPMVIGARALALPAILLGVAVVMVPPLYIASTTFGVAPPAARFLECTSDALRDGGRVLLGMAPALAFMVATSTIGETVWVLGNLVVVLAALLATRTLYLSLFFGGIGAEAARGPLVEARLLPRRPMMIYLLWIAVGGTIGANLFQGTFE